MLVEVVDAVNPKHRQSGPRIIIPVVILLEQNSSTSDILGGQTLDTSTSTSTSTSHQSQLHLFLFLTVEASAVYVLPYTSYIVAAFTLIIYGEMRQHKSIMSCHPHHGLPYI